MHSYTPHIAFFEIIDISQFDEMFRHAQLAEGEKAGNSNRDEKTKQPEISWFIINRAGASIYSRYNEIWLKVLLIHHLQNQFYSYS